MRSWKFFSSALVSSESTLCTCSVVRYSYTVCVCAGVPSSHTCMCVHVSCQGSKVKMTPSLSSKVKPLIVLTRHFIYIQVHVAGVAFLCFLVMTALRIRLSLRGCTNRPFYHIVVASNKWKRDGKHLEQVRKQHPLNM